MTTELAIRILIGDVLGTSGQTHEAIKMAVSALSHPDVTDINVGDTIYRQAALDAVEESRRLNHHLDAKAASCHEYEHRHFMKILSELPPAQLEQRAQDILQYLDEYLHPIVSPEHWSVYSELYDMVSMLPSVQPEQRWIPCSERLPKKAGNYLVTDHNGDIARYIYLDTESSKDYWMRCAKAWMPLPEPYKGGGK